MTVCQFEGSYSRRAELRGDTHGESWETTLEEREDTG